MTTPDFAASGVITITTDFGHKGPFIGVMKGRILQEFAGANIVDLTHETLAHWPAEAGFWVSRSYRFFPAGTVHIAVVDPGVGTDREIIVILRDGHAFLAPDNGLLATLAEDPADVPVYRVSDPLLAKLGLQHPSATFHGRDVLAPLAASLASGRFAPADVGPRTHDIVPSWLDEPEKQHDGVSGVVVTVDAFGNLITNIDQSLIEQIAEPVALAGNHTLPFRRTYADVRPGELLALVNSFGVVELACGEGSAADALGAGRGAPVKVISAGQATP